MNTVMNLISYIRPGTSELSERLFSSQEDVDVTMYQILHCTCMTLLHIHFVHFMQIRLENRTPLHVILLSIYSLICAIYVITPFNRVILYKLIVV
jgi:hypothetical protein